MFNIDDAWFTPIDIDVWPGYTQEPMWISADGDEYLIRELEDSHLLNILRCHEEGRLWLQPNTLENLQEEARERGLDLDKVVDPVRVAKEFYRNQRKTKVQKMIDWVRSKFGR